MSTAKARARLDKAAIAIGSMLVDEIDPSWDDSVELEAACVEYVKAIRAEGAGEQPTATDRMAVHSKLLELDAKLRHEVYETEAGYDEKTIAHRKGWNARGAELLTWLEGE